MDQRYGFRNCSPDWKSSKTIAGCIQPKWAISFSEIAELVQDEGWLLDAP
jgi:hypothetical protein